MALIPCSECGKSISSAAVSCPHCGAPVPKPPSALKGCLFWILVLLFPTVFRHGFLEFAQLAIGCLSCDGTLPKESFQGLNWPKYVLIPRRTAIVPLPPSEVPRISECAPISSAARGVRPGAPRVRHL
ncbi:MAG: zinc ribbon domain-containing protein [Thiocapsa sp.]|nr:zinc ribbon domain-containing protein [Thiocapsa sp.]